MAATVVDTTAIAAIVIGLGGTIAAMVFPHKYPNASKRIVDSIWWGGWFLVVSGTLYLITEHRNYLGQAAVDSFVWLFGYLVAIQGLPGFWYVVVFAAGAAAMRWLPSFLKRMPEIKQRGPRVTEWLTPAKAAVRFVAADLIAKDTLAHESASRLRERIQNLEANPEQPETLAQLHKELEDAVYLAKRRRTDVINAFISTLKIGLLIARGYPAVHKKGEWVKAKTMSHIPAVFWAVTIEGTNALNLEMGLAHSVLGAYYDVEIGRDEDHKSLSPKPAPRHLVVHRN